MHTQPNLSNGGILGWQAFLCCDDFKSIECKLQALVSGMGGNDVQPAIQRIQTKKGALRSGRALAAMSSDELQQFNALLDAESVLVLQQLRNPMAAFPAFLDTVVHQVLPVLVNVSRIVIPILV